jgi:mannose-6-phosphate isomerase-like protein (cupin superfamily)
MKPYRTNLRDVPRVEGLSPREGWVNMQVQFLIDESSANSRDFVLGWTVLPPGARHDRHRHFHADEFLLVLKGQGMIYTDEGDETASEGDVVFIRRGGWHGFNNTSEAEVILVWGWSGAGSLQSAGYEVSDGGHSHTGHE